MISLPSTSWATTHNEEGVAGQVAQMEQRRGLVALAGGDGHQQPSQRSEKDKFYLLNGGSDPRAASIFSPQAQRIQKIFL